MFLKLIIFDLLLVDKNTFDEIVVFFMYFFSGVSEENFGYFIPDFKDGELIEDWLVDIFDVFSIFDAFFYEHDDFLMIVVDIVMFEYFALSIVADDFDEFFGLPF